MKFEGSAVVITGAGSGIGAALAKRATKLGAKVCVSDLDGDKAQAVADEIGGIAVQCDVQDEAQIQNLISEASKAHGDTDIYVSNAGLGGGDPTHAASQSDEMWTLNWQVHVMSHVYASRALLPMMIERGSGHLVNVASAAGLLNQIGDAAYSATKHAAVSFAESLAIRRCPAPALRTFQSCRKAKETVNVSSPRQLSRESGQTFDKGSRRIRLDWQLGIES